MLTITTKRRRSGVATVHRIAGAFNRTCQLGCAASLFFGLTVLLPCRCPATNNRDAVSADFVAATQNVQSKVVKIFGAGGLRGLEAYQSGMLISSEGHVLTVWSYVLDSDDVTVVLDDGRRFTARPVGIDPLTEIAVLKLDAGEDPFAYFDLAEAAIAGPGTRVLAFSNLFGIATGNEPVSVLHGTVSGIAPLDARRGAFTARYHGDVYVLDAVTSNPGAAGGALTDARGRLLGMLGKEVRSKLTNTWLNFAIPANALQPVVDKILAGRFEPAMIDPLDLPEVPLTLVELGIVLVPDVVTRTPPFVDQVLPDSSADRAGLRPDDLVVMFNSQVASSCREVEELAARCEQEAAVVVTVLRDGELLEFPLNETAK